MSTSVQAPYHRGNLRQALLETGLEILAQKGEAELGLRDLARLLGVSSAAPYRHFANRAALLEGLAVIGFQRLAATMQAVAASRPADPMPAMGKTYVLFALENANLFRLMFAPHLKKSGRPDLRQAADAAFDTLRHLATGDSTGASVDDWTRDSINDSLNDSLNDSGGSRVRALAAWAKIHGLAVLLLDGQIAIQAGEDIEALVETIIGGL